MDVDKVIQYWAHVREGTIETIDEFTDQDLSFTAFAGGFSVGEIIQHIPHEEYGEIQYGLAFRLKSFPVEFRDKKYATVKSLKALLSDTHAESVDYLRSLNDSDLENEFEAQWGERKVLIDFVLHLIEHEIHHRGELSLMLGLLGRKGFDV